MPRELSVALPGAVDETLGTHLLRTDGQEDLAFALWTPSEGSNRFTALVNRVVLPFHGDRQIHGNASFNTQYFERVCQLALREALGIAFLHSHPFPGWQGMSADDIEAERRLAGAVSALTGLPLLGMTVGTDATWSARMWQHAEGRRYQREWCTSVRAPGTGFRVSFHDRLVPRPAFREMHRRTVSVWGDVAHASLARLRIGIVGLGSVGALVAETLARMGMTRFVLIDFDRVEPHNLDRLVIATQRDIGRFKVDVAEERMRSVATAEKTEINATRHSVAEEPGYRAALDCDVIFSCADRPRARHILNHFAFAHLIPVIDGGIGVRFKRDGRFSGVDWQVQSVRPGSPCLECLAAYDQGDVSTEEAGMLDDPSYMAGLPSDHRLKRNENVFPFSANVASLEVLQLVAMATGAAGITDVGVQRYRYNPGIIEQLPSVTCRPECDRPQLVAQGDRFFCLAGRDIIAERSRAVVAHNMRSGHAETLSSQ